MAADWIKMRTDLYRDPKVCVMADLLLDTEGELARYVNQMNQCDMSVTRNVMRNVTVGALVSVWGVVRHKGERVGDDLVLPGLTLGVVDDIADLPGFGGAMSYVGWIAVEDDGIKFPGYFREYNSDPIEEQRKKNAERQRRHRNALSRDNNVTRNVTVTGKSNIEKSRVEKSREDIKYTHTQGEPSDSGFVAAPAKPLGSIPLVPIPDPIKTPEFEKVWSEDWIPHLIHLNKLGRPPSQKTMTEQLLLLAPLGPTAAIATMRNMIARGKDAIWIDPPRGEFKQSPTPQRKTDADIKAIFAKGGKQ